MGTTAMVMYAPPTAPSPSRRQRTTRDTKVDRRTQALLDYFREVDAHTLEIEAGPKALQKVTKSRAQEQIGTASRDSESNVMARGHCVEPHPSRDIASPSALVPEAVQAKEDDSKETSPALGGLQSTAKRPATASTDAAVGADDAGGGLSVLERLLRSARKDEEQEKLGLMELPPGHHVDRCQEWQDPRLKQLMARFQAEDERIGAAQMSGRVDWPNVVYLLIRTHDSKPTEAPGKAAEPAEAVAYVWSQLGGRSDDRVDEANLPRIHHLYVREDCRGLQLGRRLLHWWRGQHALHVEAFAVTEPNQQMQRLLQRNGCTHVLQRSGFEGSGEHFHALPPTSERH